MKTIAKLSFSLAAVLSLALAEVLDLPRREAGGKWQNASFRATRRRNRTQEKAHCLKDLAQAREG